MAKCSFLFHNTTGSPEALNRRITPSEEQMAAQRERWNDLRDYLVDTLSEQTGLALQSWLQGSYKFRSQIRPMFSGEEFDIDLGIYFKWDGSADAGTYTALELKEACQKALITYRDEAGPEILSVEEPKKNCNRIRFKGDFHIDVPVYHLDVQGDIRTLASQDGWVASDPKAIYVWFRDAFSDEDRAVVRRLIRYLKAWSILRYRGEEGRPSSILLTVLAAEACMTAGINASWADDDAIAVCLDQIVSRLEADRTVLNPAEASKGENLARLTPDAMETFIERCREFLEAALRANAAGNALTGAFIWQELFGHFFPLPEEDAAARSEILLPVAYPQPEIKVVVTMPNGTTSHSINQVGPVPKKSNLKFFVANIDRFPREAHVQWVVRNTGEEASRLNDLGHTSQCGTHATESTAYNGRHFMDCMIVLHGNLIAIRRVPVHVNNAQYSKKTASGRPAWTTLR